MLSQVGPADRIEPGPGQESVWDYPRPPRLERTDAHLRVELGGIVLAETRTALRVLETSQPPAYYFPPGDVAADRLTPTTTRTFCEWKGLAHYLTATVDDRVVPDAAWTYPATTPGFEPLVGHIAFYAQAMDGCWVDGEPVQAMDGTFYGGWITSRVLGPFKGGPGTAHW